jgi:hypothetical protein
VLGRSGMRSPYWPLTFFSSDFWLIPGHPFGAAVTLHSKSRGWFRWYRQHAKLLVWRFYDGALRIDLLVQTGEDSYAFWTAQVVPAARRELLCDRVAGVFISREGLDIREHPPMSSKSPCRVERISPALTCLVDYQMMVPLVGKGDYEGFSHEWEVVAITQSPLMAGPLQPEDLQPTMKILPFHTTGLTDLHRLLERDPAATELFRELALPLFPAPWPSLLHP